MVDAPIISRATRGLLLSVLPRSSSSGSKGQASEAQPSVEVDRLPGQVVGGARREIAREEAAFPQLPQARQRNVLLGNLLQHAADVLMQGETVRKDPGGDRVDLDAVGGPLER